MKRKSTTDREKTEDVITGKALHESEKKYRTLIENVNIGLFRTTGGPEGRFLHANPATAKIFGYDSVKEFLTIHAAELYQNPEDRERLVEKIQQRGLVRNEELELKKRDGTPIWASVTARVQYDERGEIGWIDGVVEDITERKKAEEALHESEERYRLLFNGIIDAVYVHGVSVEKPGKIIAANQSACLMLGYTIGEFLQMEIKEIDVPEQASRLSSILDKLYRDKRVLFETYHVAKDGRKIPVEVNAQLFDMQGTPAVLSVVRDITKRKAAEEALRESEEKFSSIVNSAIDGILIADVENKKFIFGNRAICRMLDYTPEEITNLSVYDIHPESELPHAVNQFEMQAKGLIEIAKDIPVKRKDGNIFYADIASNVIRFGGKTCLVGIFRDVTEQKKAEKEIRKRVKELEDFYDMAVGRELRIKELKEEIEGLKEEVEKCRKSKTATPQ
jgi:PAS domain S-box-containing protein